MKMKDMQEAYWFNNLVRSPKKQVSAMVPKEHYDEYLYLKSKLGLIHAVDGKVYRIALVDPFTQALITVNKELRECLDKHDIECKVTLEHFRDINNVG
jgi:hypothetical protein